MLRQRQKETNQSLQSFNLAVAIAWVVLCFAIETVATKLELKALVCAGGMGGLEEAVACLTAMAMIHVMAYPKRFADGLMAAPGLLVGAWNAGRCRDEP